MQQSVSRLAIVDRGHAAMRLVHTVRELNFGATAPIALIALFTEPEREARFVREADEAWRLESGAGDVRGAHREPAAVARALRASRCDAAWVGWGLSAREQLAVAEICEGLGILVVGSDAGALRRLGDASQLAAIAEMAGVPLLAHDADCTHARRVGVPVIADRRGTVWPLGVCEHSCEHRGRTVIAEVPSPGLDAEQESAALQAAQRIASCARFVGVGAVEFAFDPTRGRLALVGFNAFLPSEHALIETITGIDLVKMQLGIAEGATLEGPPPARVGHAIAATLRVAAPASELADGWARIALLRAPTGPGIRVDSGVAEGDRVLAEAGSPVARLIAFGRERADARARLRRAIAETIMLLDGATTNQGVLRSLLARRELDAGEIGARWLDELYDRDEAVPSDHGELALLQAAVDLFEGDLAADRRRFYAYAQQGRPQPAADYEREYELRHRGRLYSPAVSLLAPAEYRVTVEGHAVELWTHWVGSHERRLELRGSAHRVIIGTHGEEMLVEIDGVSHRVSRDDHGVVRNVSAAIVVSIPFAEGDLVQAGDVVAVVESMKMQSSFTAPFGGRIRHVLVRENARVVAGAPLVVLEELAEDLQTPPGERLSFVQLAGAPDAGVPAPWEEALRRLRWLVLGYDIDAGEARRLIECVRTAAKDEAVPDEALLGAEHRLLEIFADVNALFAPRYGQAGESPTESLRGPRDHVSAWLRSLEAHAGAEELPGAFVADLRRALRHYGVERLARTPALERACYRVFVAHARTRTSRAAILAILNRRLDQADAIAGRAEDDFRRVLDRLIVALEGRDPVIADLARDVRYRYYDRPVIAAARERVYAETAALIAALVRDPGGDEREALIGAIVDCPRPLATRLSSAMRLSSGAARLALVEAMARRYYRVRSLSSFEPLELDGFMFATARYEFLGTKRRLGAAFVALDEVAAAARAFAQHVPASAEGELALLDLYTEDDELSTHGELASRLRGELSDIPVAPALHRVVVAVSRPHRGEGMSAIDLHTFRPQDGRLLENEAMRGLHPMTGHRLELWRLREFDVRRLPSLEDIYAFHCVARANPQDERLVVLAEVRDLTRVYDDRGEPVGLPELEQMLVQVLQTIRTLQAQRPPHSRLHWNRVLLYVWPVMAPEANELQQLIERMAPLTSGLGIEVITVQGRLIEDDGRIRTRRLMFQTPTPTNVTLEIDDSAEAPLRALDESARRLMSARRRGMLHPAEIVRLLAPVRSAVTGQPAGEFVEHDLNGDGTLAPVDRPPATNTSGIVVGTVRNFTERYPEGMLRVILLGDPTHALGAIAEPECDRILAAIDLAERLRVPLEWFALSAGARIAMDKGTEMMDAISSVLARIVSFTQNGEINVVSAGINVGAQPYFNAESTMLMNTRGALIMTPESAMVLTGKQSLDYAGAVSAEDNFGIGGYERIMGPNGAGQYWARDLAGACRLLLQYYEHTYVAPDERFPRRAETIDPAERDVRSAAHDDPGTGLPRIGEIFLETTNPGRKKPFNVRSVMKAVIDSDHPPLERWGAMEGAENAVVWDAHLGAWPVSLIGIEARPLPRRSAPPADGPDRWSAGTLFPRSAKKIARAINANAGRRPLVILANLSGFDGSPESLRDGQLEYGAEVGRAIVNFDGPIVFCVLSRYHGGSFVVFSRKLNANMETIALEGSHASVIGGGSAAAVVFAHDVEQAARADARVAELDERITAAAGAELQRLRVRRNEVYDEVLAEKRREFAARFDAVHSVERAVEMGSVNAILPARELRPYLVAAVARGIARSERSRHSALGCR